MSYKKLISVFVLFASAALPAESRAGLSDILSGGNIAKVGAGVIAGLSLGYYLFKGAMQQKPQSQLATQKPENVIKPLENDKTNNELLDLHKSILPYINIPVARDEFAQEYLNGLKRHGLDSRYIIRKNQTSTCDHFIRDHKHCKTHECVHKKTTIENLIITNNEKN